MEDNVLRSQLSMSGHALGKKNIEPEFLSAFPK